jgi:hypothetical protein
LELSSVDLDLSVARTSETADYNLNRDFGTVTGGIPEAGSAREM